MPQHPLEAHIGQRLYWRRALLGISQAALGKAVNVSSSQIQKYESGESRVPLSRLYEFSKLFGVSISYFSNEIRSSQSKLRNNAASEFKLAIHANCELFQLVRGYYKIKNTGTRKAIYNLMVALAAKQ